MNLWDRFQLSISLLALWSTLTLATTGEIRLSLMASALALPPLAYLLRRPLRRVPWWIWDLAVLLVFVRLMPVVRQNLLNATVYFFISLQCIRLLSFRRLSDAYSIYVVSFFQVFAAALLTTSPAFGLAFLGYLLLLVRSLLLHSSLVTVLRALKRTRAARETSPPLRRTSDLELIQAVTEEQTGGSLLRPTLVLGAIILALSVVFFVLVPRLSTRRVLQTLGPPPPSEMSSAFDENIELGKVGTIQLDTSVALYVKPLDEVQHPSAVRLRGVALDTFDGKRWQRTSWASYREPFGMFCLRPYPLRKSMIIQPANTSKFLFGETFPFNLLSFDFQQAVLVDHSAGVAWLPYPPTKELHYTVVSRIEDLESRDDPEHYSRPSSRQRRTVAQAQSSRTDQATSDPVAAAFRIISREFELVAEKLTPSNDSQQTRRHFRHYPADVAATRVTPDYLFPPYREACLRIPEELNKNALLQLAREITRGAKNPYEQALAIESYLRRNYQYSLELADPGTKNPVEHFLFESRRGHCEYYATAMAMLLRALEIPCRVVNGYYSTEWNNLAGMFTVRQRDAHSWVEVFFDGYGWMTFDPTPPGALQRPVNMNPILLAFTRYYDALKMRWYRAVIDFSIQDQRLVAHGVFAAVFAIGDTLGSLRFESGAGSITEELATAGNALVAGVAILFLLIVLVVILRRRLHRRSRGRRGLHVRRSHEIPRFYAEILSALRRRGYIREPSETPLEFATRVAKTEPLRPFHDITVWYYGFKYGGVNLPKEAHEAMAQLRENLRKRNK